jgi:hypothetical protein
MSVTSVLCSTVQGRFQVECDLTLRPSISTTIVDRLRSLRSRNDLNATLNETSEEEEEDSAATMKGRLVLDSGEESLTSFANKGIERYSIQSSTLVPLELTMAFWLEESAETVEEEEICTPIDQDVLRYCQAGDYLTFYVKGEKHPVSVARINWFYGLA